MSVVTRHAPGPGSCPAPHLHTSKLHSWKSLTYNLTGLGTLLLCEAVTSLLVESRVVLELVLEWQHRQRRPSRERHSLNGLTSTMTSTRHSYKAPEDLYHSREHIGWGKSPGEGTDCMQIPVGGSVHRRDRGLVLTLALTLALWPWP